MTNLIGAEIASASALTDAAVHVYGKSEARPGRKMGHVTRLAPPGL
jgi:5-(carboxyamino)imidazole ribonucleotide synthase